MSCFTIQAVSELQFGWSQFGIPLAHQAQHKQQAIEGLRFKIKIQEATDGLRSGRFKSIWAVATALGR